MSVTVTRKVNLTDTTTTVTPGPGQLLKYMTKNGRTPPISLSIFTLEDPSIEILLDKFISYKFSQSILVPVDTFNCEVFYKKFDVPSARNSRLGLSQTRSVKPKEGDLFVLRANGVPIASGIVDQLDMETDAKSGTKLSVSGRNLLGQWEDQDSVSLDSKIVYGNKYNVNQIVSALAQNTRIDPARLVKRFAPAKGYLAATQPGESKLSSMQRYCEALDIYFWMSGDGNLIVGRPDMYGTREGPKGKYFLLEDSRNTNVLTMRSTRASTQIPNIILPIWNGQEGVQALGLPQSAMYNNAEGPARLRNLGHRTPKAVVVSTPEGSAPQDLAEVNTLLVAKQNTTNTVQKAGASTILQAYAKRELARANIKEIQIQVNVPGHYNDNAEPLIVDQVYRIQYDIDDIDENMYLYEVEYTLDANAGPQSKLFFCRQKAIVSDVRAL